MLDETIHTLVVSSNAGRYACDDANSGHDLTAHEPCAIQLGGQWIEGRVEHGLIYATHLVPQGATRGYYFISGASDICGLCIGMKVRLYRW